MGWHKLVGLQTPEERAAEEHERRRQEAEAAYVWLHPRVWAGEAIGDEALSDVQRLVYDELIAEKRRADAEQARLAAAQRAAAARAQREAEEQAQAAAQRRAWEAENARRELRQRKAAAPEKYYPNLWELDGRYQP